MLTLLTLGLWWPRRGHNALGAVTWLSVATLAVVADLALFAGAIEAALGVSHLEPDLTAMRAPMGWPHLLGTDELGRDVLGRLLFGARVSLSVAVVAALSSAALGTLIGVLAGYFRGVLDDVLMRFTDAMIALPVLPLMILLAAVDLETIGLGWLVPEDDSELTSVVRIVLIIVAFGWMTVARLARAATLSLRELDFVAALKALGASDMRIILVHIVPNALAPVLVTVTLEIGGNILYEAALSFLGLGVQPPVPSWGNMLDNARELVKSEPLLALWPGLLIVITASCFNFVGDGLRDVLDPHHVLTRRRS